MKTKHKHKKKWTGRRLGLRYGSAKTELCTCGAWRYYHHGWSRWNKKQSLYSAVKEAEAQQNEL